MFALDNLIKALASFPIKMGLMAHFVNNFGVCENFPFPPYAQHKSQIKNPCNKEC